MEKKTMQQIDHDAWEEGYGHQYTTNDHNNLELKAMYEALAARKRKEQEEKEKVEQKNNE